MAQATPVPPRLLLVEDDQETRDVVLDLLSEEGYVVTSATSLDEALAQVNRHVFDLILTDVIGWTAAVPLQAVERLREHAQPTPVGLFTSWNISEDVVKAKGFAYLLKKPFDVSDLFALVAEFVARPLTPQQEGQAEVVRRYCEAIDAHDWQVCAALCRENVRYYPTPDSIFDRKVEVVGRAALLEQLGYNAVVAPDIHYLSYSLYGRPGGIAARYLATIGTPERRTPFTGSILFAVEDGQIAQIGYRLDAEHLRAWMHVQQKREPGTGGVEARRQGRRRYRR